MNNYIDNEKKIEILYEDEHILVCVKPAGVLSQSNRIMDRDMVSMCRNYLAAKGENSYIAIINRLDRPVEGITLFAKNNKSAAVLSKAMREHDFCKFYRADVYVQNENMRRAIADNEYEGREIVLENYIISDKRENKTFIAGNGDDGAKYAKLTYRISDYDRALCVAKLDVELFTGRHHQIRAQLANAGMPIVGDVRYGYDGDVKCTRGTLKLCAVRLEIKHPATGKSMIFTL